MKRRRSRRQIIERDGEVCCICGGFLDMSIPALDQNGKRNKDPEQPTIEHKVRTADGGSSDLSNLGLAHYRCNVLLGRFDSDLEHRVNWSAGRGRRWRRWALTGWPALPLDFVDWE